MPQVGGLQGIHAPPVLRSHLCQGAREALRALHHLLRCAAAQLHHGVAVHVLGVVAHHVGHGLAAGGLLHRRQRLDDLLQAGMCATRFQQLGKEQAQLAVQFVHRADRLDAFYTMLDDLIDRLDGRTR